MSIPTSQEIRHLVSADKLIEWARDLINYLESNLSMLRMPVVHIMLANGDNHNVQTLGDLIDISGPTAGFAITGVTGGDPGKMMFLRNNTVQVMTIRNQNAGSGVTNRIITGTGADITANIVHMIYDPMDKRWIVVSAR